MVPCESCFSPVRGHHASVRVGGGVKPVRIPVGSGPCPSVLHVAPMSGAEWPGRGHHPGLRRQTSTDADTAAAAAQPASQESVSAIPGPAGSLTGQSQPPNIGVSTSHTRPCWQPYRSVSTPKHRSQHQPYQALLAALQVSLSPLT